MTQAYSDPKRESDPHSLPDLEIFELTAEEVAAMDEDLVHEYLRRREFRLATMNGRDREKMLAAMIEEQGIQGGWFWHACLPGCLPDSDPFGPFESYAAALADARENAGVEEEDSQ
jgi:hypothetical protein